MKQSYSAQINAILNTTFDTRKQFNDALIGVALKDLIIENPNDKDLEQTIAPHLHYITGVVINWTLEYAPHYKKYFDFSKFTAHGWAIELINNFEQTYNECDWNKFKNDGNAWIFLLTESKNIELIAKHFNFEGELESYKWCEIFEKNPKARFIVHAYGFDNFINKYPDLIPVVYPELKGVDGITADDLKRLS